MGTIQNEQKIKLLSMTDFVLEQENYLDITNKQKLELILNTPTF